MSYPKQVEDWLAAISELPGVVACFCSPKKLDQIALEDLSLPGEYGDLPQAAMLRTKGGLPGEVLIQTEVILDRSSEAWLSIEFLAWWVRDWARSGHTIQLRPVALPPRGYEIQLGRTLKFMLEYFQIEEGAGFESTLKRITEMTESLLQSREQYRDCFETPAEFTGEVEDI